MNRKFIAVIALALLYGCGSQPSKEEPKAAVEERTPAPAQKPAAKPPAPQPPPAAAKPLPPTRVQTDPLKDPANILSKRSIFYDYDSDAIKEEFRPLLQAHGKYLSQNRNAKMLIQGNCDERGSREYNLALGQRRAEGVRRMLALMGATESQIESVSLGEEKPRCEAKTEECYSQNRRSDMLYGGEF